MTEIPTVLRKESIRFIRVTPKSKKPIDKQWQREGGNNYQFDNELLTKHIAEGGNYGVVAGFANIFIIDADTEDLVNLVEKSEIADTFCVKTGSGGRHYYYFVEGFNKTKPINGKNGENIGHLKWMGSCVVGPGSVHPNGNSYVVIKNAAIKKIESEQIRYIFRGFFNSDEDVVKEDERNYVNEVRLPIEKVVTLSRLVRSGDEYQGAHPRHGSSTGVNFSVNTAKDVWKCWRHGTGGGTLHLIGVLNDVISCEECVPGGVRGPSFKKILKIAKEKYGFELSVDKQEIRTVKLDLAGVESCANLQELYALVKNTIKTYMVMDESDVTVTALWAIGCSRKDSFLTFPELFFNASKGSGKSRLMSLLCAIIPRSWVVAGISPAALFRLPSQEKANALFIDEADLNKEERADVRDILLVGYKKGGKIMRVVGEGSSRRMESYDVYMGYGMANIKGFDDIVSDRGITITLAKSNDSERTKLMEYYEFDPWVKKISKTLLEFNDSRFTVGATDSKENDSNDTNRSMAQIMQKMFIEALTRIREKDQKPTVIADITDISVISVTTVIHKIERSSIFARDAEVWTPLFLVAAAVGVEVLDEVIKIAESRSSSKDDEVDEDVNFAMWLLNFYYAGNTVPTTCLKILNKYVEGDDSKKKWMNHNHINAMLKRIKCKIAGGRIGNARLLTIDIKKLEEYLTIRGYNIEELKVQPTEPKKEGQQEMAKPPEKLMAVCALCGANHLCKLNQNGDRVCYPTCEAVEP